MHACLLLASLLFAGAAGAAELPAYFSAALARFSSDAPGGWAYTLTTTQGENVSVERFDPSRPKGGEWSLLARNGRAPNADEIQRYNRYKVGNAPPTRATFSKGDIDLSSVELLRENSRQAVFQAFFRGDVSAPLLAHVFLEITVNKLDPAIERIVMRLQRPFAPALGVRMRELVVTMDFYPPESGRPALPRETFSRFRGRMFFLFPLAEDLRVTYADFSPVVPTR